MASLLQAMTEPVIIPKVRRRKNLMKRAKKGTITYWSGRVEYRAALPPNTKLTPRKRARMFALRAEGHTLRDIARELGCSHNAVWKVLQKAARNEARRREAETYTRITIAERGLITVCPPPITDEQYLNYLYDRPSGGHD